MEKENKEKAMKYSIKVAAQLGLILKEEYLPDVIKAVRKGEKGKTDFSEIAINAGVKPEFINVLWVYISEQYMQTVVPMDVPWM